MKIGDIKIEALGLMFPDEIPAYATGDTAQNYDVIMSDYSEMLARMTGSIARCVDVIVERRVLPVKRKELFLENADKNGALYRFDLTGVADFFDVDRVIMQSENAYDGDYPFRMEEKMLVIEEYKESESFSLLYYPRITPPSVWDNEKVLEGVPEEIARLIPYFIKGELFREEEAGEAAEAMSWFEQRLAAISDKHIGRQAHVASVYSMGVH